MPDQLKEHPPAAGTSREVEAGPETFPLVWCPPGRFIMGTSRRKGQSYETPHRVTLTSGFWIGAVPVTAGLWDAVMGDHASFGEPSADVPVYGMSWFRAAGFCERLSAVAGQTFTLPTEAQWEYACRAGTEGRWYFGDDESLLERHAWYRVNSGARSRPVAQKLANPWGLYDVYGNVAEWCLDAFRPYGSGDAVDPLYAPGDPSAGIVRGGSFIELADSCTSARRTPIPKDETNMRVTGIRVVVNVEDSLLKKAEP
jgi:formylglycine-generating enzyme required for sulfatase activity